MKIQPRKRFGQHWLKSPTSLAQIVTAANLQPTDHVLEIGPGLGVLTQELVNHAASVVAVELDRDLCQTLVQRFGQQENFLLLQGDFLALDLAELLQDFPKFKPLNKVVANIPYNITGPILEKLLGAMGAPQIPAYDSIVLLMQKEVAERLVAEPKTKAYSALSVRMQYLAHCEWIAAVPRQAFSPPPQVESAVVRLTPRPYPAPPHNPRLLGQLVKLGFANRRKMLRNNFKGLLSSEVLTGMLTQLALPAEVRAEEIGLAQWIDLCNRLETCLTPPS
ncbi:16S rRNA (adenine(1518)-N(6)/adenine(1519)-N(6))-dimethyltransferase RsmA [Synechocystis sp. LKSZ1]|uniref:16S rRNA (adenine(1518)-N(6)/adenine(1519)-N(6))- dimethyltransferase RsmA n=1 Tax=Synechocystis sp. LKSZ1 TaxID=3144951 RepID=UPI00336C2400